MLIVDSSSMLLSQHSMLQQQSRRSSDNYHIVLQGLIAIESPHHRMNTSSDVVQEGLLFLGHLQLLTQWALMFARRADAACV